MKHLLIIVAFTLFGASLSAAPKPASATKKSFYTTPVREFKGAAFYQWKKYHAGPAVTTSADNAKNVDDNKAEEPKPQTAVSAKKD